MGTASAPRDDHLTTFRILEDNIIVKVLSTSNARDLCLYHAWILNRLNVQPKLLEVYLWTCITVYIYRPNVFSFPLTTD